MALATIMSSMWSRVLARKECAMNSWSETERVPLIWSMSSRALAREGCRNELVPGLLGLEACGVILVRECALGLGGIREVVKLELVMRDDRNVYIRDVVGAPTINT